MEGSTSTDEIYGRAIELAADLADQFGDQALSVLALPMLTLLDLQDPASSAVLDQVRGILTANLQALGS